MPIERAMTTRDMLDIDREEEMGADDCWRLALYGMALAAFASAVQTAAHTWRDMVRERGHSERGHGR